MSMINKASDERGQMLILSILAFTVVFIVGAIAVDIGLWLSERRGAQTDADFLALAGAWELLDPDAGFSEADAAVTDALIANDETGYTSIVPPVTVDEVKRCVSVNVDHGSRPLFFSIFGLGNPDIGAHAKACAGPVSGGSLLPFEVDTTGFCFTAGKPDFGKLCEIKFGAQGPGADRGVLDLATKEAGFCSQAGGSGDIEDLIIEGAAGPCLIHPDGAVGDCPGSAWIYCAATQPGNFNESKVLRGLNTRLRSDGLCDRHYGSDSDTVDDFDESVDIMVDNPPSGPGVEDIYAPRDCDPDKPGSQISPRLVTIIVFDEYPDQPNQPYPIVGLAGFYLAGCAAEGYTTIPTVDDLDRYCTPANYQTMDLGALSDLFVLEPGLGPLPRPAAGHCPGPHQGPHSGPNARPCPTPVGSTPTPPPPTVGPPGHAVLFGNFVSLLVAGGSPGGGDDATTFGIYLVE